MSHGTFTETVAKLERLSEERAGRVVSLIEDRAELEALEDAADAEAPRVALSSGDPDCWPMVQEVKKRLGL
jgi:hypothetical protein